MARRLGIEVGATYESGDPRDARHIVFTVLSECVAKTVRFKREEPGWRILVLDSNVSDALPGSVHEWVKDANIFFGLRRLA